VSRASRAAVLAVALSVSGGGSAVAAAAAPAPAGAIVSGPTRQRAWSARIVYPTVVRAAPSGGARRVGRLTAVAAWNGGEVRLLVLASRRDRDGRLWLRVELPDRPNGRSGWIDADYVQLATVRWRVAIDLHARRAGAFEDGRLVRSWPVVIGTAATPTPRGLFAVYERVRQPADSDLGPWALHLTAHSDTLFDYGGGPGRVALHGRDGDLLADPLGSRSSHGCVRMDDDVVSWLAARVGPGTPVEIR
jgi:hypothetical protein